MVHLTGVQILVIIHVDFAASARKDLRRVPEQILRRLRAWVDHVEHVGLEAARQRPGYHDEPLRGDRAGQRSVRLNRAWRAVYVLTDDDTVEVVLVIEVNKHDY